LRRGARKVIWRQVQEYFRHGIEVRPGDTVVDVGAHLGFFALEVLRRTQGRASITCVEPAPETHAELVRNVREVFPDAHVDTLCCAVAATSARATLYYRPNVKVLTSLYPDLPLADPATLLREIRANGIPGHGGPVKPWWLRALPDFALRFAIARGLAFAGKAREIECEVRTLSGILDERGIERVDLLKVDVEGAELDVLRGIRDEDWPKLRSLVIEVQDEDGRLQAIQDLLARHGLDEIALERSKALEASTFYVLHARRTQSG
jgi:FkbM family methyltransferase